MAWTLGRSLEPSPELVPEEPPEIEDQDGDEEACVNCGKVISASDACKRHRYFAHNHHRQPLCVCVCVCFSIYVQQTMRPLIPYSMHP